MGTNFFMRTKNINNYKESIVAVIAGVEPRIHLGKRSAAGAWCFDCGITLCKDGIKGIHDGKSDWYKEGDKFICPKCKKEIKTFCSSWTWAVDPGDVFFKAELMANAKKKIVVDEYGTEMTGDEFMQELERMPVKFSHVIGADFS
jgi:hypothetical protein